MIFKIFKNKIKSCRFCSNSGQTISSCPLKFSIELVIGGYTLISILQVTPFLRFIEMNECKDICIVI